MTRRPGRADGEGRKRPSSSRESRSAEARRSGGVREWIKTILVAALLYVVLRTFVLQTFVIISGSMKPTLLVGDMVVVNRVAFGSEVPLLGVRIPGYSAPHRGDIVVFQAPPQDTTADTKLVKRVVGIPGDTLQMRDRVLFVDGKPQAEPYVRHLDTPDGTDSWMKWQTRYLVSTVDPKTYVPTRDNWGPLVIPEGRYFMMGDNREESLDSRYWGLVDRRDIEGRPILIYFSYNRDSHRPFPWLREIHWGRIGTIIHGAR